MVLILATVTSKGGLAHYWPFDSNYDDVAGSANGTVVGAGVSISTVNGEYARGSGGLKIDSNAGAMGYIDIAQSCIPNGQKQVSVSAWYRYEDIGGDGSDSRRYVWSTHPDYSCEYSIGSGNDGEWYFRTVDLNVYSDNSGPVVTDGLWHHAVTIWDRNANKAYFYHDGIRRDEVDTSGTSDDLSNSTGFHIGDYRDGNGGRNFDGYIDDVAVFNHALTAKEVLNLFNGASPRDLARPKVRAVQLDSISGNDFTVLNATPGFEVDFQALNLGDHQLHVSDSRILQGDGVIIGNANDGGDSIFQASGDLTYTGAADARYDNGFAFSTADLSGGGEKNFDMSFAHFPFNWSSDGWIAAHIASDGSVLAGPNLPSGTTITKLDTTPAWVGPGNFVMRIPNVDSRSDGMLFIVGGENDNNVTVAGIVDDPDDVHVVSGDAALGDWHIHIRSAAHNDTSDTGEDGTFSFLFIPYNTLNLIGGWVEGDGGSLRKVGDFTASDGDSTGQVDIAIPDGQGGYFSPADGILILACAGIRGEFNSGTNEDPVEGNVLSWSYDVGDSEFVVHGFDAPSATLQDTEFVFAFVPYEDSLQLPPRGTRVLIR